MVLTTSRLELLSDLIEQIKTELPGLLQREGIPGISIALVNRDSTLWEAGFGITDRIRKAPVTPATLFSMQSCSKTFTATAILLAVQEGLVELEQPIVEYMPGFHLQSRFDERPEQIITLRHLLSHKAGFTHEAPVGNNYENDAADGSFEDHILSLQRGWLRHPVGQRYEYANLGVDLAGYILEKISGIPFAEYVRQRLFTPLGMTRSTFDFETFCASANRALGHDIHFDVTQKAAPQRVPMIPSGGLYTCAADVARFIRFHLNRGRLDGKVLLQEKYLDEMYTIPWPEDGQIDGYGLGIALLRREAPTLYNHMGGGFGFLADMLWHPQVGIGIVILTNSSSHNLQFNYSSSILEKMSQLPIYHEHVPEAVKPHAAPPIVPIEARRLKVLCGQYAGRAPAWLEVRQATEGGLEIKFKDLKEPRRLCFTSDTDAYTPRGEIFIRYRFIRAETGRAQRLVRLEDGTVYDFNGGRDQPVRTQPARRKFPGSYVAWINGVIPDISKVRVKKGQLILNKVLYRYPLLLTEYRPGLFFTSTGEAVDFTGVTPLIFGVPVRKIGLLEELHCWSILAGGKSREGMLKLRLLQK